MRNDPDGTRLPIKLDTTTNGEFAPVPLARVHHHANALALDEATRAARRLGVDRRRFLVSACGAASTLLAFDRAQAHAGPRGGFHEIPAEAALDEKLARSTLDGNEFIFDVQGHFVNPRGEWTKAIPPGRQPLLAFARNKSCDAASRPGLDYLTCLDRDAFIKDVFLDSDTDVVVLSFVPSTREREPLTIEEAAATSAIVAKLAGTHRMLVHGRVNPNQPGDVEAMDMLAERYEVAAWKTYTQWGPDGRGFALDDDVGLAFIEKARKLGVRNIAIHKGLPFGQQSYEHSTCADIGRAAKRFPDVNFLVYHSGFVADAREGPYDPKRTDCVDGLVTSVRESGVAPGSNVYAELGSTWRFLMRDPDAAAHVLGKLFAAVGVDNVLWGTDSIWYGSPQDQIQAFRTFQISDAFAQRYGYPKLTPAIRAKVFGRNALAVYKLDAEVLRKHLPRDRIATERRDYREAPDPTFVTYGPKTRREFLALKALCG
jgi:predicted TIM-barrel fold metal-dependent hydrolase